MAHRLRTTFVILALAGGVAAGGIAWQRGRAVPDVAAATAVVAPVVPVELASLEVAAVAPEDIARTIRVSGSASPKRQTVVTAEVSGRIEAVEVEVGDAVAAGQTLARFDTVALRSALDAQLATLEAREAQRRLAASVLDRARKLGTAGISSEATLLSAEADLLNLQAQVRGLEASVADARKALADAVATAPFDGVVAERKVEPGQSVPVNTELLTVVDLREMEIEAMVPTSRIAEVRVGQHAAIRLEGTSGRTLDAAVARIAPVAVAGSRAVRVFLSVDNAEGLLRGGLFATGEIEVERFNDVIALPAGAIRRDEAGAFVLKAVDGRLRRQGIDTGAVFADRGTVEIAEGLKAGDIVVTAPLPDLKPDVEVTIVDLGADLG